MRPTNNGPRHRGGRYATVIDEAADHDAHDREHAGAGRWLLYVRHVERCPEVASVLLAAAILAFLCTVQYELNWWPHNAGSSSRVPSHHGHLYHPQVFDVNVGTRMCQHHSDALLSQTRPVGVTPFLLPITNETHGVRTRCFANGKDSSSYACERDLLGLVSPVFSQRAIAALRQGKPLNAAADWVRIDESWDDIRVTPPHGATPRSLTSMPDYLATREFLERHRFWRTSGKEGLREQQRPKVFLDIGPNGGYHTVIASMYGFDVIAFEPVPASATALQEAMCLHDYISNKVTVANFTPGLKDEVCLTTANSSCYSTLSMPSAVFEGLMIRHRPVDQMNLPFVSVVKIDAGYRTLAVLLSLQATLRDGGYDDPSIAAAEQRGDAPTANPADSMAADAARRTFPVTVVCVRVPLNVVPKVVHFLWSIGMIVAWRDIDRGVLEDATALTAVIERAKKRLDKGASGLHLFARPRERVDTPDHVAGLKAAAKTAIASPP